MSPPTSDPRATDGPAGADDPAGADLDLTPRDTPTGGGRRRWGYVVVTVVVLGAALGVLWKGLSDATLFFYNADEAVAQRDTLGDGRFRLQGTVLPDSVMEASPIVAFTVTYNGVLVDVEHTGAPPDLFQEGMPVVLDGRWDGDVYASDNILVKHDEVYVEDHGDRIDDADAGSDAGSGYDTGGGGEYDADDGGSVAGDDDGDPRRQWPDDGGADEAAP